MAGSGYGSPGAGATAPEELLRASGRGLRRLGRLGGAEARHDRWCIKPNLVISSKPETAIATHPGSGGCGGQVRPKGGGKGGHRGKSREGLTPLRL